MNKLQAFLYKLVNDVDYIMLFGGGEDMALLEKYHINLYIPFIDIQKILQKQYNKLYSLDLLIDILDLKITSEGYFFSKRYKYNFPKKSKKLYRYEDKHLEAHHASGDCVFLFLVYQELFTR